MTEFNDRRSTGRIHDLGEHIRQNDAAWKVASPEERQQARKSYADAGWKLCPHKTCPPWSCER